MQGQMRAYIFKRLLLMIPTILGVLTLTFAVVQFVPGGPVEQMVLELKGKGGAATGGSESSGSGSTYRGRQGVDAQRLEEVKALYGFDKPPLERYFMMLGRFARFDFLYPVMRILARNDEGCMRDTSMRPSADRQRRPDAEGRAAVRRGAGGRWLRDPPQPVRLFPLAD